MEELRIARGNYERGENTLSDRLTISVEEMGKALGIGRVGAYKLSRSEGFPTIRIGGRVLISVQGLKEWIASHTAQEAEEQ